MKQLAMLRLISYAVGVDWMIGVTYGQLHNRTQEGLARIGL